MKTFTAILFLFSLLMPVSESSAQTSDDSLRFPVTITIRDTSILDRFQSLCEKKINQRPSEVEAIAKWGAYHSWKIGSLKRYVSFVKYRLWSCNNAGRFLDVLSLKDSLRVVPFSKIAPHDRLPWMMEYGRAYFKLGRHEQVVGLYKDGIDLAKNKGDVAAQIQLMNNLAVEYQNLNQFIPARKYLEASLALSRLKKIDNEEMRCVVNLAHYESQRKNFGEAIQLLLQALQMPTVQRNPFAKAHILSNLSWSYYSINDYPNALACCRSSIFIREKLMDSSGLARSTGILARIQLKLGDLDSARISANRTLLMVQKMGILSDIRDDYETLAMIEEQSGDFRSAYFQLRQYLYWKDSALKAERDATLKNELLSLQYNEAASLKTYYETRLTQTQTVMWICLSLVLLLLPVLIVLIKRHQRMADKNMSLSSSVTSLAASIDQRIEPEEEKWKNSDDYHLMKARIDDLALQLSLQQKQDLANLQRLLREADLQDEHYWNEFQLIFSNVYPKFYEKLMTRQSKLTQNELRLAALIKLNVSMQDAGNALNVTPESVRKARYRLYKKMNLTSDQELVEMLITM